MSMSTLTHIHSCCSARYHLCGPVGSIGWADWIKVEADDGAIVFDFDVQNAAFARALESAARQCAEAIEAREARPVNDEVEAVESEPVAGAAE